MIVNEKSKEQLKFIQKGNPWYPYDSLEIISLTEEIEGTPDSFIGKFTVIYTEDDFSNMSDRATILKYDKNGNLYEDGIGRFKGRSITYEVRVWINDGGNIPHCHITSPEGFDCCVKLEKPEYFKHGKHKDTFGDNKTKKAFNEFMYTKRQVKNGIVTGTNWDYAVYVWNNNNSKMNVSDDIKTPDYLLL